MSKPARKKRSPARRSPPRARARSAAIAVRSDDATLAGLTVALGRMIDEARRQVAVAANAALTTLYWQIGDRVRSEVLGGDRAAYGAEIVAALGRQLEARYGRGFGEKNLRRMVQFAAAFPDPEIVAALRRQLGWSHFKLLLPLKDPLQRDFYAEMCRIEGWSTRQLAEKLDGMLYERTALSRKPEGLVRKELASADRADGTGRRQRPGAAAPRSRSKQSASGAPARGTRGLQRFLGHRLGVCAAGCCTICRRRRARAVRSIDRAWPLEPYERDPRGECAWTWSRIRSRTRAWR